MLFPLKIAIYLLLDKGSDVRLRVFLHQYSELAKKLGAYPGVGLVFIVDVQADCLERCLERIAQEAGRDFDFVFHWSLLRLPILINNGNPNRKYPTFVKAGRWYAEASHHVEPISPVGCGRDRLCR